MEIIIIGILALALLAGLALFVFKNAAKIVALVLVVFIGYIGWHIYLKDKGINPTQATEKVSSKGEKVFNKAMDSMIGVSDKALNIAKERTLEATEKAKDTSKHKATEITTKAKKKAKEKVNEVLE